MDEWVNWLLWSASLYGHIVGLSNFEFDLRTGRVYTTTMSTFLAILSNVLVVVLLVVYFTLRKDLTTTLATATKLHEYVFIVTTGLQIMAGLLTIVNRWRQRRKMMHLVRCVIRVYRAKPQVKRMGRWAVLLKIVVTIVTHSSLLGLTANASQYVGPKQILGLGLQFVTMTIMNLAISQHFLIMLLVRANYLLLNRELRQMIDECKHLSYHSPRNGIFMTKCCFLADQLDNLARIRSHLHSIVTQLQEVFGLQALMVYTEYYITTIGVSYFLFSLYKYGDTNLRVTTLSRILLFTWMASYYLDALINLAIILQLQGDEQQMSRILAERTLFAPGLDVRLEESFENIQIQLVRNPLKMNVMHLFPTNYSGTTAMVSSVFMNSIYLIQYDMANF
ncbi:hypothetical protein KR067_012540 [Drosophila pandora]|nr:hypothetical protein KR067_012540 [Drosophila pandora]